VDAVVVGEGKNLEGRALGFLLGTVGKSVLEKAFGNTVRDTEARNSDSVEAASICSLPGQMEGSDECAIQDPRFLRSK
jgi:hypothetical protein